MHTESSLCQSHESSRYSSFVFVAVLFPRSNLAYLFAGVIDQFCGSCDFRHLHYPDSQCHWNGQPEDANRCRGMSLIGPPKFIVLNHVQIWCGAAALCDIFIAICMTYYASFSPFQSSLMFILFRSLCAALLISVAHDCW